MPIAEREQEVYQRMRTAMSPEEERQRLALEQRLAAQGRLGVQTAAYGGTPEQLAMQKAIQEQQSADSLASIQGARQLQGMDIQNLSGMLGASGISQEQLTAALQPSLSMMPYAQRAGDLQAQALSNLGQQGMTGMVSAVNSEALLRQAQMESIMNGLGVGQKQAAGAAGEAGGGFNYQDLLNYGKRLFSSGEENWDEMSDEDFFDWVGGLGG